MAADLKILEYFSDSSGQSLMEFVFGLPLMLGLAILMVKVNTAIQVSIVDQKYARAQALFLAYNSPFYPEKSKQLKLRSFLLNQILVGVSGNLDSSANSSEYTPEATVQSIARSPKNPQALQASNENQAEPKAERANVRIRNTVTLCTQNYMVGFTSPGGPFPVNPFVGFGLSNLFDFVDGHSLAAYCGSKMKFVIDDQAGT